jgi:hypothetical protein
MGLNNETEGGFVLFREVQEPDRALMFISMIAIIPILIFWRYVIEHDLILFLPFLIFGPFYLLSSGKSLPKLGKMEYISEYILSILFSNLFLLGIFKAVKSELSVQSGLMGDGGFIMA